MSKALRHILTISRRQSPLIMLGGALLFIGLVSASANQLYERQDASPTSTVKEVTGCHFHDTVQYCLNGATEFRVVAEATATATTGRPESYTGCHFHGAKTYCFEPTGNGEVQIVNADETAAIMEAPQTTAATRTGAKVTAITDCHLSQSSVFCSSDATEYYVQATGVTKSQDVPPQYTGCHAHEAETYCLTEYGEAPIFLAADVKSGAADPHEKHCHFHAGVEHCTGGDESEVSCERTDRDYKIGIRVGMLFVILAASSIGVFGPILMSHFIQVRSNIFLTVLKQFGTGVIISTAFIHLYTHASLMFGNKCLGELKYEATTSAILMAGLFISFLIEFVVHRAMRWQAGKKSEMDEPSDKNVASAEMANITIMEAGIIFHSLLIGLTLVVAGDSFFITLSIVIIFHQMFEGIALGTRIASLGHGTSAAALSGLSHAHFHDAPSPQVDRSGPSSVSLLKKLVLASGFAIVTPIGMAIGIGVLKQFNGNDPSTIIAIGTLDAFSAGILVWVGLVEMWAHDWMLGGELTNAGFLTTALSMVGLLAGMILMSFLGKWA